MPPVREILLGAHTHDDVDRLLLSGVRTWDSPDGHSTLQSTFSYSHRIAGTGSSYSHRIAGTGSACEVYDYSRDLAIEGYLRFAARDTPPGTHAETQNVILVGNPTEREHTEAVDAEVDGAPRRVQS